MFGFIVAAIVAVGLFRSSLGYKAAKASGIGTKKDWLKAGLAFGFTTFKSFAPAKPAPKPAPAPVAAAPAPAPTASSTQAK